MWYKTRVHLSLNGSAPIVWRSAMGRVRPHGPSVALLLASAVLLVAPEAGGQAITGSLFGTVTDASGSRLPGVTVTAQSPQLITGQEVRITSDQGVYRFPTLPPGTYSMLFDLQGFQ